MPLLGEAERQGQPREVDRRLGVPVGDGLDAAADLVEVAVHGLLVNLEVVAQVLRVHLKVVDDARKDAAVRHQQVHVELAHLAPVRELAPDALDDGLGRRRQELLELLAGRYGPRAPRLAGLAVEVEEEDEEEVAQHAEPRHRLLVARHPVDARRHEARGHLDALLVLHLLLPLPDGHEVEDVGPDDLPGVVDVLDVGRVHVGHRHGLGLVHHGLQLLPRRHGRCDLPDRAEHGASRRVDLGRRLSRLLLGRDGVEHVLLDDLLGLLGTKCLAEIRLELHHGLCKVSKKPAPLAEPAIVKRTCLPSRSAVAAAEACLARTAPRTVIFLASTTWSLPVLGS